MSGPLGADSAGEVAAAYGLDGFPFAAVVGALFVIVLLRAQGTYWLGRGVAAGTIRMRVGGRLAARLSGPGLARALAYLHRWGPVAVTLSFLTVGIQTMVNGAAGLTRMPYLRYTLAMVPGCIAWAFIYATVGLTAFYAAVTAAAGSPWALLVVIAAGAAITRAVRAARRRSADRRTPDQRPVDGPVDGVDADAPSGSRAR